MADGYKFYKSFEGKWLALEKGKDQMRVWYSNDGVYFFPTTVLHTSKDGGACIEYFRGAEAWRINIDIGETTITVKYLHPHPVNGDKGKPIFRLQDPNTLGTTIFDTRPKWRYVVSFCKVIVTGHLICITRETDGGEV